MGVTAPPRFIYHGVISPQISQLRYFPNHFSGRPVDSSPTGP